MGIARARARRSGGTRPRSASRAGGAPPSRRRDRGRRAGLPGRRAGRGCRHGPGDPCAGVEHLTMYAAAADDPSPLPALTEASLDRFAPFLEAIGSTSGSPPIPVTSCSPPIPETSARRRPRRPPPAADPGASLLAADPGPPARRRPRRLLLAADPGASCSPPTRASCSPPTRASCSPPTPASTATDPGSPARRRPGPPASPPTPGLPLAADPGPPARRRPRCLLLPPTPVASRPPPTPGLPPAADPVTWLGVISRFLPHGSTTETPVSPRELRTKSRPVTRT